MSIKVASHLYRNRHGTFYFRLVIPRDLRICAQRAEVRFSLHTEQRCQAITVTLPIIAALPALLNDLRRMAENDESLPPDYFKLLQEEQLKNLMLRRKPSVLRGELDEAEVQIAATEEKMAAMFTRAQTKHVGKVMHDRGALLGKREIEDKLVFPLPPERTVRFSELKTAYLNSLVNNRMVGGNKKPPTESIRLEYERSIDSFVFIMGDKRIGEIDRAVVGQYITVLRKLPPNLNKSPKYKGKSIEEILALGDPPIKESTCSKKIERISFMFKWALEEKRTWGIDANPFTGYGQADSDEPLRRPFTHEELSLLLNHPSFVRGQFSGSYMFWLIPLATYTGSRLGELAQLDLKDFVEVDGIACIDINDEDGSETVEGEGGAKKRVKTKNAKRLVPIHSELIRIGILRHVERLRTIGQLQLFPELSRNRRRGPAHPASKWLARFREKVGINSKHEVVFHSFRHLFITTILDESVPEHMLAPIVGHEAKLVTGQVYWNKKDAKKRQPTVETFTLPDDIRRLFLTIEDVTFSFRSGPLPSVVKKSAVLA